MDTSDRFCEECGAANELTAETCFACAHPLDTSSPHERPIKEAPASDSDSDTPVYMRITFTPDGQTTLQPVRPAPPPPAEPLFHGRYKILGKVGTGGFGAVYKARDFQANGRMVAIKAIELDTLSAAQTIEATDTFNRELSLLSTLDHPHLPAIYEHFSDETHWYLVMDFIHGEPLDEYLQQLQTTSLPLKQVLNIGRQLCDVLRYLHQLHPPVIFRDLKPANIMLTPGGRLYLIDFGIARRFRPGQTRDTTPLGSPGFAAPEQYGKAQTTPRSDIYSLGATLYFLLTGFDPSNAPFNLPPIRTLCPTLPEPLAELITSMLALNPANRPTSISAVQHVLNTYSPGIRHTTLLPQTRAYMATASTQAPQTPAPAAPVPRWKAFLKGIFSLAMTGLVIAACTLTAHFMGMASFSGTDPNRAPGPASRNQPPTTFRMPYIGRPVPLNPFTTTSPQDAALENLLFGRLVNLDTSGNALPGGIAKSWDVSPDGLRWTFHLNPGAVFSDHIPIIAEDVAASLNYALLTASDPAVCPLITMLQSAFPGPINANNLLGNLLSNRSIQVPDRDTLTITLSRPSPFFLNALSMPCGSIVKENDLALWGSDAFWSHLTQIAFSSTYTVSEQYTSSALASNRFLVLTYQSGNNYRATPAAHAPATLIVLSYPSDAASYAAFEQGQLDMSPMQALPFTKESSLHIPVALTLHYYGMNYLARPFDNLAIRQAFALALNKMAFVTSPWSFPVSSLLAPWQNAASSAMSNYPLTGDPVRARELLASGLRAEGLSSAAQLPAIALAYQANLPGTASEATLAATMWHKVLGVTVTPRPLKNLAQQLAATHGKASLQLWLTDYTQPAPGTYAALGLPFAPGSPLNAVNYGQNFSSDAAQQQQLQAELATQTPAMTGNTSLAQKLDQQLMQDVAWLPMYRTSTPYVLNQRFAPPFSSAWSPWIAMNYCTWNTAPC